MTKNADENAISQSEVIDLELHGLNSDLFQKRTHFVIKRDFGMVRQQKTDLTFSELLVFLASLEGRTPSRIDGDKFKEIIAAHPNIEALANDRGLNLYGIREKAQAVEDKNDKKRWSRRLVFGVLCGLPGFLISVAGSSVSVDISGASFLPTFLISSAIIVPILGIGTTSFMWNELDQEIDFPFIGNHKLKENFYIHKMRARLSEFLMENHSYAERKLADFSNFIDFIHEEDSALIEAPKAEEMPDMIEEIEMRLSSRRTRSNTAR